MATTKKGMNMMKMQEKASMSILKTICVAIIFILISGITVLATNANLKDVKLNQGIKSK